MISDYRNMDRPKDQTLLPTGLPKLNLSKPFDPAVFALNFRTNLNSCKRLGITIWIAKKEVTKRMS